MFFKYILNATQKGPCMKRFCNFSIS